MKTDEDTLAHMRYNAIMSRRSAPPRCHPVSILVLVLSGGLIFIGLTMTVISNWPGVTSYSGNPLKIAGPVLLAIGGIAFLCGIILSCYLNGKDKKRWNQKINTYAINASRQALNQSNPELHHEGPSYGPSSNGQARQSDEIKQNLLVDSRGSQHYTSSSYTDDYVKGEGRYNLTSNQPSSSYSDGLMRPNILPVGLEDYEDECDLPTPVRTTKKKSKKDGESSSLENLKLIGKDSTTPDSSAFDEESFNMGGRDNDDVPQAVRKTKKKKVPTATLR